MTVSDSRSWGQAPEHDCNGNRFLPSFFSAPLPRKNRQICEWRHQRRLTVPISALLLKNVIAAVQLLGATSLYLAAKVEEQPRSLRDIAAKATEMVSGPPVKGSCCVAVCLMVKSWVQGCAESDFSAVVSGEERSLLTTLAFDMSVTHPYELLGEAARELEGEEGGWETLAQVAGQLLNDR